MWSPLVRRLLFQPPYMVCISIIITQLQFISFKLVQKTCINVYSTQKSFSVILILVVTFTVVIFGQIQWKKKCNVNTPRHFWSCYKVIFGHLYLVMLAILFISLRMMVFQIIHMQQKENFCKTQVSALLKRVLS